jgi:tetratricopeptide (TPR) repeat protein
MDSAVTTALAKGTAREERGDFAAAARYYAQALAACPPDDHYLRGAITINLGQMAERRGAPQQEAIEHYINAAEILSHGRGEAALQRGHALMNVGRILIDNDLPESVVAYREAVDAYESYPYTSIPDVLEAKMALAVAEASFPDEPTKVAAVLQLWEEVREVPSADINPSVVLNFASLLLVLGRAASIDIDGLAAWAGPEIHRRAVALNAVG